MHFVINKLIIKIILLLFCVKLKSFLLKYMQKKRLDTALVEMWMNGAIIGASGLILISIYQLFFL